LFLHGVHHELRELLERLLEFLLRLLERADDALSDLHARVVELLRPRLAGLVRELLELLLQPVRFRDSGRTALRESLRDLPRRLDAVLDELLEDVLVEP